MLAIRRLSGLLSLAVTLSSDPAHAQLWENRNRLLLDPLGAQTGALFGYSSAVGDFDGDGFDDLAVSAPFRDLPRPGGGTSVDTGIVYIFRGGPAGLSSTPWYTDSLPFDDDIRFGFALLARDFDADGRDELTIGEPGMPTFSPTFLPATGAVSYLDYIPENDDFLATSYGTWSCGCEADEAFDQLGSSMAAGDFDGDGFAELVIGTPYEDRGSPTSPDSGVIIVLRGSANGPFDVATPPLWSEEAAGWLGAQAGAEFGGALATGYFNFDQYEDLAIGEPGRDFAGGLADAGRVRVLYGSATGLTAAGSLSLDGLTTDVGRQGGERFGEALVAEDFNHPGVALLCLFGACIDDLAIGAPHHATSGPTVLGAGRIVVVPGLADGLDLSAATSWNQNQLGGTAAEPQDLFGSHLSAAEMDGRPGAELVVSTPDEDIGANLNQGLVHLLFGGDDGVSSFPPQIVDARPGFAIAPGHSEERLGWSTAAGDFDGDGVGDLAVGAIGYTADGQAAAGALQILYGALFADGFGRGSDAGWSAVLP